MKSQKSTATFFNWSVCAMLVAAACSHTVHADDSAIPHRKPDVKAWKADQAKGKDALSGNDLPEAETFFKAALDEAQNFEAKDPRLAESLKDLAGVDYAAGKKADAELLLRRATEVMHGSSQVPDEVRVLMEYGSLCTELRHYDEAMTSFERVQSLVERHLGRSHPLAVEATMMLAEVDLRKGDYAAAEPLLKRGFELFRNPMTKIEMTRPGGGAIFGHDVRRTRYQPNYAYAFEAASKLNYVYLKENKPDEAAAILKQAFELADSQASASDPVYAESLYGLGISLVANGNLEAAKTVYDKLLVFIGKAKGPAKSAGFDSAFRLQGSLAGELIKQQKPAGAELLYTSLAAAADKNLGPESRESDQALASLAQFYLAQRQFEKAGPLFQRQLVHIEKFQPDGVALAPILAGLETIDSRLGRDADLAEIYQKQIRVYEKMFGQNSIGLVKPLTARAALLRKLHRDAEAELVETRANSITAAQAK